MNISKLKKEINALENTFEALWVREEWYTIRDLLNSKILELQQTEHIAKVKAVKPGEKLIIKNSHRLSHIGREVVLRKHRIKTCLVLLDGESMPYQYSDLDLVSEKTKDEAWLNYHMKRPFLQNVQKKKR